MRDKLNQQLNALNRLFTEKYSILRLNPAKMSNEQRQRYYVGQLIFTLFTKCIVQDWKEVECDEVQGRFFITEADIKNASTAAAGKNNNGIVFKFDSVGRSILSILRHLGRIREMRTPGVVRIVLA